MSECVKCQQILRGSVCVNPMCPLFDGDQSDYAFKEIATLRTRVGELRERISEWHEVDKRHCEMLTEKQLRISALEGVVVEAREAESLDWDATAQQVESEDGKTTRYKIPLKHRVAIAGIRQALASLDEGEPCGECGGSGEIDSGGQDQGSGWINIPCPTCQGGEDD